MSETGGEITAFFRGEVLNAHPTRLPEGTFQADEGGDRFKQGSWRRRRGMRRTDVDTAPGAVVTLAGFNLPGGGSGLLFVSGTTAYGALNAAMQGSGSGEEGLGEGGLGEGGAGL